MKIRPLISQDYDRVSALLREAFPDSNYEVQLVKNLHKKGKTLHEWVCIHCGRIIAYVAFSNAYAQKNACGFHLAPIAVNPQFQKQGIGAELLRFSLRQDVLKESTIFVLGAPGFYQKFGFEHCAMPICPFDKNNDHFLSIRNNTNSQYIVGYEPEFKTGPGARRKSTPKKKRTSKRR